MSTAANPQADVFAAIRVMAETAINKANVIAKEVAESRVNVGKLVSDVKKESTDEKVKVWREWMEKMENEMEKRTKVVEDDIKARLIPVSKMSEEVFTTKKEEYKELKKQSDSTLKLAKDLPGYSDEYFKEVPALVTLAGGTAGTSTGVKRPRLSFLSINGAECFVEVTDKEGAKSKSYTFTNAAQTISKAAKTKVSPSDLSAAALEAAKTDNLSDVNDVEFSYSVNGTSYMIHAIPAQAATKEEAKKEEATTEAK